MYWRRRFIDESPRWLIVRGRYDDAMLVLRRAERLNKVELPPEEELRTLMEYIKKEVIGPRLPRMCEWCR